MKTGVVSLNKENLSREKEERRFRVSIFDQEEPAEHLESHAQRTEKRGKRR